MAKLTRFRNIRPFLPNIIKAVLQIAAYNLGQIVDHQPYLIAMTSLVIYSMFHFFSKTYDSITALNTCGLGIIPFVAALFASFMPGRSDRFTRICKVVYWSILGLWIASIFMMIAHRALYAV